MLQVLNTRLTAAFESPTSAQRCSETSALLQRSEEERVCSVEEPPPPSQLCELTLPHLRAESFVLKAPKRFGLRSTESKAGKEQRAQGCLRAVGEPCSAPRARSAAPPALSIPVAAENQGPLLGENHYPWDCISRVNFQLEMAGAFVPIPAREDGSPVTGKGPAG